MRAPRRKAIKAIGAIRGVGVDHETGIIHHARFIAASMHDSQEMDALLTGQEQAGFADKAYDSADRKRAFRRRGIFYGVLEKAHRNRPLSTRQETMNRHKSRNLFAFINWGK